MLRVLGQVEACITENEELKARLAEEHAKHEAAQQTLQAAVADKDQVIAQLQEELEAQMAHHEEIELAHDAEQQKWAHERAAHSAHDVSLTAAETASSQTEAANEAQRRAGRVLTAISRSMVEVHVAIIEVAQEWSQAVAQTKGTSGEALANTMSEAKELIDEFKDLGAELHETTEELKITVERQEEALEEREK